MRCPQAVNLAWLLPCIVAVVVGCTDGDGETALRSAWEEGRSAGASGDYVRMWTQLASSSKAELEQQRSKLKAELDEGGDSKQLATAVLTEFGISPDQLADLNTHDYFIAMMEGLERTKPELRQQQVEELQNATIDRIEQGAEKTTVHWKTSSGTPMTDFWIREDGTWKVVANVN